MSQITLALFAGLAHVFSFPGFLYMTFGVVFGLVVGFIPGLSGLFALAVLLPFLFGMNTYDAIDMLLGAHAVTTTGGAITSILFGTPGTGPNMATVFDGFPMAQQGQGARAIGIATSASAMGGIVGALVLALLVPILKPLVLAFGPPEFFAMSLLGIAAIASLTQGNVLRSLVAGGFGLLLAFVGQVPSTGTLRYTFGSLYLWKGVPLIPVITGLFAISEMIHLGVTGGTIVKQGYRLQGSPLAGIRDVFRHWWLFLRCSFLGTAIGIIPGLGAEVANFVAYGHAVQSSRDPSRFGSGAPEGVIAPQAADNAKEGGGLVPTLAFGIPGGAGFAVLLGAFYILGLDPGPKMLTTHLDIVFTMVWIIVVANVLGAMVVFLGAPLVARVTTLRSSVLVPVIVVVALVGSYATNNSMGDIVTAIVFGVVGYYMKKFNVSRATLIIGLVLGSVTEGNLLLSLQLYGLRMFERPITAFIILLALMAVVYPAVQRARRRSGDAAPAAGGRWQA